MTELKFLNRNGDFVLRGADRTSRLYFPLANEGGMMSSITPNFGRRLQDRAEPQA